MSRVCLVIFAPLACSLYSFVAYKSWFSRLRFLCPPAGHPHRSLSHISLRSVSIFFALVSFRSLCCFLVVLFCLLCFCGFNSIFSINCFGTLTFYQGGVWHFTVGCCQMQFPLSLSLTLSLPQPQLCVLCGMQLITFAYLWQSENAAHQYCERRVANQKKNHRKKSRAYITSELSI